MREGYILTRSEAGNIFLVLSQARLKLNGKYKTLAQKLWEKFETALVREKYNV